jgi:hypothetical protein
MSRAGSAALALAATAWCGPLWAQAGAIVDPENPGAASGGIVDPENPGAASGAIVDPENPGVSSGAIVDPENPGAASGAIVDPENPGAASGAIVDPENAAAASPAVAVAPEPAARSGETRFRGSIASIAAADFAHDVAGEDTFGWRNRFALSLRHRFSDRWSATVSGALVWSTNAAPASGDGVFALGDAAWSAQVEPRLDDLMVSGRHGQWLFRFGNFVTSWGVSDFTNPVNIVNPVDYRAGLLATSGEGALAVPTLDATWVSGRAAWQFLIVPFFVPHRIDLYGSDNAIGRSGSALAETVPIGLVSQIIDPSLRDLVQPLLVQTKLPEELPQNVSLGSRAVFTAGGADIGLGYFFGFDRQPHIETSASLQGALAFVGVSGLDELPERFAESPEVQAVFDDLVAGKALFSAEYRRQHTFVFDFVRYFGPIGVRAEAAFSPQRGFYTTRAATLRRPSLSTAFGLGWESGTGEIVVGAEVFHTYGFTREGDGDFVLDTDELLGIAWGGDWDLGSVTERDGALSQLGLRVGGVILPQDSAALLVPELHYELTEATDLAAGALIVLTSDSSGPGDLYRGNGQAWLRVASVF